MKFFYQILCAFLITYSPVYAQSQTTGWVEGYIITNQNDTLRGQLFNRDTEITLQSIRFRPMPTASYQEYTVDDMKGLYLRPSNERFTRQTVRIDQTPYKVGKIQNGPEPLWGTETLLLKELVSAGISLFHYHDKAGRDHFWVKVSDNAPEELVLITYYDSENKIRTQRRYRQQLFVLAQACPSLQKQTINMLFTMSAIQQFVTNLNNCLGNKPLSASAAVPPSRKLRFDWGVQAGVTKTTIQFEPELGYRLYSGMLSSPLQLSGGLWGNLFLPTNRQQWSIYGSLNYQGYKAASDNGSVSSDATYIKVLTAFRWQQPGDIQWKFYALLGITNGLAIHLHNNYRYIGDRAYEQAVVGGLGLQHKRSFVELRHERGNGTALLGYGLTGTRTTGLFLGYML